jgi:hypothetical protein
MVEELIAGLPPESSATVKYIVGLATSLGKPALATRSHIAPAPYCPYRLRIIPESLKHKVTIANAIVLLRDLDMMLKGICYWRLHQKTGRRSDK